MGARFELRPGLADRIADDPGVRRAITRRGGDIRRGIRAQLPSGRSGGRRVGAFARKSYVEPQGSGRNFHVRVGTRWRIGHLIEFGSANNQAYSPLRRAVLAAGLKLSGGGR